jgi:hypothetical protein
VGVKAVWELSTVWALTFLMVVAVLVALAFVALGH